MTGVTVPVKILLIQHPEIQGKIWIPKDEFKNFENLRNFGK
jgi:hypothetical protein